MKLPVLQIVLAAYRLVFDRPLRLVMAMVFGLFLVGGLWIVVLSWESLRILLPYSFWQVLFLLPYLLFGLLWCRLYLNEASATPSLGAALGPTRFAYLLAGSAILVPLWLPVTQVPFMLVIFLEALRVGGLGYALDTYSAEWVPFALLLLCSYFLARISLIVPAQAVGQALSLRAAWRATRGNGFGLLGAYLLVALPLLILSVVVQFSAISALYDTTYMALASLGMAPFLLAAAALFVTVMAEAYRQLVGPPPHAQIILRFA